MINTMTGSPEMQPLMTVGRTAGGQPGLSARRKNGPTGTESNDYLPATSWSAFTLSVTLTQALAGAGHPSALTVRTIARGALDMSRLPDKIILA